MSYRRATSFVPVFVIAFFLLGLVLSPADSVARITKCGGPGAKSFCLEYETEHLKVGESQTYTIVGSSPPFQISFVQNGDKVRLERIDDRSFRLTAVKETTGFGVGPVQFYANETKGYRYATGHGLLYISVARPEEPPAAGPPKPHPPVQGRPSCDISGTWRHGTQETWTFTPLGGNRYSAREEGFGHASGTAVVTGNQLRIDYVTRDGRIRGYYAVEISADCRLMSGRWSDNQPASGQARMVRLTTAPGPHAGTTVPGGHALAVGDPGWEVMTATGKGTGFGPGPGQSVTVADNIITIAQSATDRGGALVTKPITPLAGKILRITKETMVHHAGSNYTGMTVILGQDASREVLSAVGYYHYDRENYFGAGFLRTPFTTRPVWDAWFREVITYDPATGRTTLSINNGPPLAYAGRPASGPFRLGMHSYGWGTGHYQKVRALSMEWTN
ncbi:MAG: hypothetical protein A4E60_02883 [Syntrophorhabdus sp. PtaB.Bin047]|nr:MAG: hypothetical protein A4E60_02883 [Syntrophorhabdus sp. PtaB.Bin047]